MAAIRSENGAATRTPFSQMPPATRAGILCNDPQFRKFAATRSGFPNLVFSSSAAAEFLRTVCRISSRAQLNTNASAAAQFEKLRTEFDAWAGRIARPR